MIKSKKKSKKAQATSIPRSVKEKVWERQKGRSLFSPYPISVDQCCCHYISRNMLGMGIEENIFGCTEMEHKIFDGQVLVSPSQKEKFRFDRNEMKTIVRNHLILNYPGWKEEDLIYNKFK